MPGHMPVAFGGGLVVVQAMAGLEFHIRQIPGEFEIGGRRVCRIDIHHDQRIHLSGFHRINEFAQRRSLFGGAKRGGLWYSIVRPVFPSFSLIACTSACTYGGCVSPAMTTLAPRCDSRSRTIGLEPLFIDFPISSAGNSKTRSERTSEPRDIGRMQWNAMVGFQSRDRWRAFKDIEPIHA